MLVTFDEYKAAGGQAVRSQEEYEKLEPLVEQLLDAYIKVSIPYWRIKKLEDYGLDFKAVIVNQLEFIQAHGGLDYFQGNSDLTLKTVTTSGFSYSMDSGDKMPVLYNLPLSAIAKIEMDNLLLKAGLSGRILM
jgi:hypothetical protein